MLLCILSPRARKLPTPNSNNYFISAGFRVFLQNWWKYKSSTKRDVVVTSAKAVRGNLTEQSTFEDILQGTSSIQNTMNKNLSVHDLIYNSIRLEMDFSICAYTNTFKFGRDVAPTGHLG